MRPSVLAALNLATLFATIRAQDDPASVPSTSAVDTSTIPATSGVTSLDVLTTSEAPDVTSVSLLEQQLTVPTVNPTVDVSTINPITLPSADIAPVATSNPPGSQFMAALPSADLPLNGMVVASSPPDGKGVDFQINLNSLPGGNLSKVTI